MPKALLLAFSLAAVLACGPGSQPVQTGPSDAEAKPTSGGVLRVHERLDPFDWDITFTGATTPNTRGIRGAYDTLLDFKSSPEVNFSEIVLMPGLAEKWESGADGKTFTFHLNKNARWANLPPVNGRALTSADVKWGLEYLARIGPFSGNKPSKSFVDWAYAGIAAVETPDPATTVVRFNEPNGAFLGIQATAKYAAIMPKEILEKDGNFKDQMAGSGPFQLDAAASQKGTRWVFKKNANYYRDGQPYLDEIRWLVLPEESTAHAAFKTQQVDLLDLGVEPDRAAILKKDNPNAVAYRYVEPAPNQFFWNVTKAPMSDVRVRKAVQLSINRDEFVQTFAGGEGAWGLSGAIGGLFSESELKSIIKYDPNEAKRLLGDAGFPTGLKIDQLYAPERGARYVEELQLLQAQLKKTGIDMQLVAVARNDQSLAFRTGDFQTTSVSNANFAGDIGDWIYSLYMPNSVQNFNKVNDPGLTEILTKLGAEPDPAKRKELVRQGAKYIYENALGLAIYHSTAYQFWQPQVKGFAPNYWRRERSMVDAWVAK